MFMFSSIIVLDINITGALIKGFQLHRVFIAATPGLRTPNIHGSLPVSSSQVDNSRFCHFRDFSKVHKSEKVKNYQETLLMKEKFQGKTKLRFKMFGSVPEAGNCKNKSLSSFGVSQMINLGVYFLSSYFGKLKGLNSVLQHPEFACTFGDENLFQSLNALLYGLLTEKQFVYANINKLPIDFFKRSLPGDTSQDLHYFVEQSFLKENHLFKDTRVFKFRNGNLMEMLYGSHVTAKDVIDYVSNSFCLASESVRALGLSYDDVSDAFNVSDFYNKYLTTSFTFQTNSFTRTFSVRKSIKKFLAISSQPAQGESDIDNSDLKIIMIDDLFMLSVLVALNLPATEHLFPSSRLVIESFIPASPDSVLQSVDSELVLLHEQRASRSFQEGERNDGLTRTKLNKTWIGFGEKINEEKSSEKGELNKFLSFMHGEKDAGSEEFFVRTVSSQPMPSPFPAISKEEKSIEGIPSSNKKLVTYVRVLYNGQVVTRFMPGCKNDPVINLGLCSFEALEALLDREQLSVRDEL